MTEETNHNAYKLGLALREEERKVSLISEFLDYWKNAV